MTNPAGRSLDTAVAQALHFIDSATGGIVPPIHTSTTYARDADYELIGDYTYSRYQNPSFDPVEKLLAHLDGGAEARIFASGLAAAAAVFETVDSGRHIVAPRIMYHGLQDWLRRIAKKRRIGLSLVDPTDLDELRRAVGEGDTAIVWVESLANPTWDVIDVAAVADIAHDAGAILAADCTVSPPVTMRGLELGADIVFHSTTKYLNGHSDVTGGVLVTRAVDALWDDIKEVRKLLGAVPGPFDAWLLLRGLRTLSVRFERASNNALKIAHFLQGREGIAAVLYPGLEDHPGHAIAQRQMRGGFGGMLSVLVDGGLEETRRLITRLKLFVPATSLGGVESLAEHRKVVEGPRSLVPENLIRFSIGIENADDLIGDLEQALAA